MKRRSYSHDYSRSGFYHITISTTKALHQPLGRMAGCLDKPDGDNDAPHVVLSPLGRMVEQELTESIQRYYPMLKVLDYIVMPEHLHFLLVAYSNIVSRSGRSTHLGHVIAGFKYGCNKRYWAMTGRAKPAEPAGTISAKPAAEPPLTGTGEPALTGTVKPAAEPPLTGTGEPAGAGAVKPAAEPPLTGTAEPALTSSALSDSVAKPDSPPLFDEGYCDVMPIDEAQIATQRAYIHANPRNRLLRMSHRQWLQPQRMCVDTHLSLSALRGYLQRECMPSQFNEEVWMRISDMLIVKDGMVCCDRYGSDELLHGRLLPVVCHRKDARFHDMQLQRCLDAACDGAVMVSARIAKGEQAIIDAVQERGYRVVIVTDNGFPEIYHPSEEKQTLCAMGKLLLLTPWKYHYRTAEVGITVAECKTMNCIAQAICRMKDSWWV